MSLASEALAERIRDHLAPLHGVREQKMFGGIAFMLNGHMLVGPTPDGSLLVRIGKAGMVEALARPGAEIMKMGDRTMNGFILVGGDALEDDDALASWIDTARAIVSALPPK